jgi:para-aminobenzoate synthetase component 1
VFIETIPFHSNITLFFSHFAEEDHAVLLDSGKPLQEQGRYDIFSAWPSSYTQIQNGVISHLDSDKNNHILSNMQELKQLLHSRNKHSEQSCTLPFIGGWIGFASYELAYFLESSLNDSPHPSKLSAFFAGYYPWAVIQDHHTQEAFLIYEKTIAPELLSKIRHYLNNTKTHTPFKLESNFTQNISFSEYQKQFQQIQHYLDAGDCYQVNLALHFQAKYTGSPFSAYQQLRQSVPSPHMAYFNSGEQQILSISPERFIAANQSQVSTKPIKGTSPRSKDATQDKLIADALAQSSKNRAENLMIVDLLRNDLGRHCLAGSIKVDELFAIESFENVHHLVSTISGELKPESSIWDVFFDSFPGGSITGAPKIRACQIISELEKTAREIYCGSLFYASNNGFFDSSIPIRTLLCDKAAISAWAGGGIVKDSTAIEEYEECQSKINHLLKALGHQD